MLLLTRLICTWLVSFSSRLIIIIIKSNSSVDFKSTSVDFKSTSVDFKSTSVILNQQASTLNQQASTGFGIHTFVQQHPIINNLVNESQRKLAQKTRSKDDSTKVDSSKKLMSTKGIATLRMSHQVEIMAENQKSFMDIQY